MMSTSDMLQKKADWIRRETLLLHKRCKETRIASSLSCVELLTALFYGDLLYVNPRNPAEPNRDRFIISKGHGSVSFFPILADLGFINAAELGRIGRPDGLLKAIPDPLIPGYETVNGSLGHGLGVACGIAEALMRKKSTAKTVVLMGDGELYEGSVWEAVMLAGHRSTPNLVLVIDKNGASMLDFCRNIIDLDPLDAKFKSFGWKTVTVSDGHDLPALMTAFHALLASSDTPKVLIAETVKGKGVPSLEVDPMSHLRVLSDEEIDAALGAAP